MRLLRGNALIAALALVAITAVTVSGIAVFATSHSVRQRREADYALALQLAEAGVNYELRYVSTHLTTSPNAHLIVNPSPAISIPGVQGSFTVFVRNTNGTTNWTLPNDMTIVSTGTVGTGNTTISRTVAVDAKASTSATGGAGLFDGGYTVFALQKLLFKNNSSVVNGIMGANGPAPASGYNVDVQSNGVGNANASGKPLVLAGGATLVPGNAINPNKTNNPGNINTLATAVSWPTVDTIVTSMFGGWSALTSSSAIAAQWAKVRMYTTQSRVMSPSGTTPCTTYVVGSTILNNSIFNTKAIDNQPTNCLIFPPGDYYFSRITIDSNGFSGPAPIIYLDTAAQSTGGTPGPVRFWVGGTDSTADYWKMEIRYTSTVDSDKAQGSRIFYSKNNSFTLTGNGTYAGIYGVRQGSAAGTPATIILDTSAKVTGAVVADFVTFNGGVNVNWPTGGVGSSADYKSGGGTGSYAYAGNWREIAWLNPTTPTQTKGSTVFSDGTNR